MIFTDKIGRKKLAFAAMLLTFSLVAGVWVLRGHRSVRRFSADFFGTFDTMVSFTAFAHDEEQFNRYAAIVRDEMTRLHRLFDIYHDYDNLINMKSLNDAAGKEPLPVDQAILDLLEIGKEAYEETEGAFNIALGPVLSIWRRYRQNALSGDVSLPSPSELEAAAVHILPRDILIDRDRSTVFLRYRDMRIDVGAVGKGYAVQKTVERLRNAGLKSGLISAGGNVAIIGPPLDGRGAWNIGVHAPVDDPSTLTDILVLPEGAVVTSGSDQRYYVSGEKRYHHIIDPQTFYPAEKVRSVTVVHSQSTTADVLSTAAFIMPREKAEGLLGKKGAEAVWILEDGSKVATEGYDRFVKTK